MKKIALINFDSHEIVKHLVKESDVQHFIINENQTYSVNSENVIMIDKSDFFNSTEKFDTIIDKNTFDIVNPSVEKIFDLINQYWNLLNNGKNLILIVPNFNEILKLIKTLNFNMYSDVRKYKDLITYISMAGIGLESEFVKSIFNDNNKWIDYKEESYLYNEFYKKIIITKFEKVINNVKKSRRNK